MSSKNKTISRREFLTQGTQAAAGIVATGTLASSALAQSSPLPKDSIIGANERINVAVMGIRSRGNSLAQSFPKIAGVRVKTLVDVDENLFPERVQQIEKSQEFKPQIETDIRVALDDKEIDALVIASPNHWHALATIWACQASKHVYVEKPCCHNIYEGRKMVEAARKYDRIVSVGFQNRSSLSVRKAMKFLQDGGIGDVYMARGLCFKPRDSIGRYPDSPVPSGVHYDLWLGPAPKRPFNKNRFHYNWHWHWDYGNGDIGNQGPHQFDIARWGMNKNEHPVRIFSPGGYFAFDSCQETANTQIASLEYADGKLLIFEVRGIYTNDEDGIRIGNLFYGTKGWMHLDGNTWKTFFGRKNEPGPTSSSEEAGEALDPTNLAGSGDESHLHNFIAALRSGKATHLTCPIEEGYMSSVLPHLANISFRLERTLVFNGAEGKFKDDKEADLMLTRDYRDPFVVPEKV